MKAHRLAVAGGCIAVVAQLALAGVAHAGETRWTNGFEGADARAWWTAGNAGIDFGRGLAHTGQNNGWARNTTGWNAVNAWVSTYPGARCLVTAWIRTSDTLTDGYISVRSKTNNRILNEWKLAGAGRPNPQHANYNPLGFYFYADGEEALFYVGLWGNGRDSWIQVDDVTVTCPTPF